GHHDAGAVGDLVTLALAAELIHHADLAGARHRDPVTLGMLDGLDVVQLHGAAGLHLHARDRRSPGGRAADVEGAHGQLRARLADGLGGDHADRFADVHADAARQVTSVALGADAVAGGAGDGGTDLDLV